MNSAVQWLRTEWIPAIVLLFVGFGFSAAVTAQPTSVVGRTSIEDVKGRLADAQTRRDLEPALKAQIVEILQNAVEALDSANNLRAEIEKTKQIRDGAEDIIQRLERELRAGRARSASLERLGKLDALPLEALERLESSTRKEAEQARLRVDQLQRQFDEIATRQLSMPFKQGEVRDEAASRDTRGRELRGDHVPAALIAAQRDLANARELLRQVRLVRVEQETAAQPARFRIAELELYVAQTAVESRTAQWNRVRSLLKDRRRAEITKTREQAVRLQTLGANGDPALATQARTLERGAQATETSIAVSEALATLYERREQQARIEQTLRGAKRRAASATEGGEFSRTLQGQISALPAPDQYRAAAEQRAAAIAKAADARLDVERARARIADRDRAVAQALADIDPALPPAARTDVELRTGANFAELSQVLEQLEKELDVLLQTLRATSEAELELLRGIQDIRAELLRLLIWIPVEPVSVHTLGEFGHAVAWLVAPANWRSVADTWQRTAKRNLILVLLAALVLVGLVGARGWLKRRLLSLAPGAISVLAFRAYHTIEALVLTLLLALPIPFALWAAGAFLEVGHDVTLFAQSAGVAFRRAGEALLFFRVLRWLFDPGGVAINHFNWHKERVQVAQRELRWLTVFYVPPVFIAVIATTYAPGFAQLNLGRLAFVFAMIAVAILWRRAFPAGRTLMALDRDESAIGLRLIQSLVRRAPVWFAAGLALLSVMGFYFLAIYLHGLVLKTILLVLTAGVIYGLISLWLGSQRLRLAEIARQASAAAQVQTEPFDESPSIRVESIDAAAIDAQTRKLINMLMTLIIGAGLWLIWSRAFDTLDIGTDFALWTYTEKVDGKLVIRTFPLLGLLAALAVGAAAIILTRNIGGMLDIVLLQRLRLQVDANYAIKTVARYLTAGVGIVIAFSFIGVSWSSVQWLVAALGVGLGFGLQEIVANFVAGLIVLGERPIRIGDWVTVGDTSGKVTRIRARATIVTDWDNKEVLIPNKAFITERVTNWTLSDQTTRLLLKVGVAYGTDPVHAERVLSEAVRANPDVLETPASSVYFVCFGESSMDFEIRAYVDATSKRLRITHELNTAIAGALATAGIEIPFPQRDLHIRSSEALHDLKPKGSG